MADTRILHGNVLSFARLYHGERFHALLCDPPYHLSIVKRFGKDGAAPAQEGTDGAFARASRGFMNKQWDGGDIAFQPKTWAALADLLYPGAFLIAFAGSRGWHRQAVAMEDAGLIMHPSVFGWGFGQGFPKATQVKTDDPAWSGHRYGGQALKPALEPVLVFQRPYDGRPVDNITQTGAGALNIDGGRLAIGDGDDSRLGGKGVWNGGKRHIYYGLEGSNGSSPLGRWPANLALLHLSDCRISACAPDCPVAAFDAQAGQRTSGKPVGTKRGNNNTIFSHMAGGIPVTGYGDSGKASRFFHVSDWNAETEERLLDADPVMYEPKASRAEREAGLDGLPEQTINDGRPTPIDNAYQRGETTRRNVHPTIKPIALTRWLATLLLPPDAYAPRRLLVPFAGVGSEMIGAAQAGWDCVVGIEGEAEYCGIARQRLAYWAAESEKRDAQLKLFE